MDGIYPTYGKKTWSRFLYLDCTASRRVPPVLTSPSRVPRADATHTQMPQGEVSNVEFHHYIHLLTQIVASLSCQFGHVSGRINQEKVRDRQTKRVIYLKQGSNQKDISRVDRQWPKKRNRGSSHVTISAPQPRSAGDRLFWVNSGFEAQVSQFWASRAQSPYPTLFFYSVDGFIMVIAIRVGTFTSTLDSLGMCGNIFLPLLLLLELIRFRLLIL